MTILEKLNKEEIWIKSNYRKGTFGRMILLKQINLERTRARLNNWHFFGVTEKDR